MTETTSVSTEYANLMRERQAAESRNLLESVRARAEFCQRTAALVPDFERQIKAWLDFSPEMFAALERAAHGKKWRGDTRRLFLDRAITPESRRARAELAAANPVTHVPLRAVKPWIAEIFERIGYLDAANERMKWIGRYRLHFLAGFHDPKIGQIALDPAMHERFLRDDDCDPAALHKDRTMLESFLRQGSEIRSFTMNGNYWKIVLMHLRDRRVRSLLESEPGHSARLRQLLHSIFWHDWRWDTVGFYHADPFVKAVNAELAAIHGGLPVAMPGR